MLVCLKNTLENLQNILTYNANVGIIQMSTNKFLERNYPKVYKNVVPFVAVFGNLGMKL